MKLHTQGKIHEDILFHVTSCAIFIRASNNPFIVSTSKIASVIIVMINKMGERLSDYLKNIKTASTFTEPPPHTLSSTMSHDINIHSHIPHHH